MTKNLINIIFVIFISTNIFAKELNKTDVGKFAINWMATNSHFFYYGAYRNSNETFSIKSIEQIENTNDKTRLFVVELLPKGFILISSDDRLKPIIGYSSENNFNYENSNIDKFLNTIIDDLDENLKNIESSLSVKTHSEWDNYYMGIKLSNISKTNAIYGPFLISDWGQGSVAGRLVYNYYTPNNWPTGCVAAAAAQIFNYYKWPKQGISSHWYYDNGQYLSTNYEDTFYDWENILDNYENVYFNLDNQKAVGLLQYHIGVALNMDYEPDGSTSSTADMPSVLHSYFRYSGGYKDVTSSGFWTEVKNNMLDERPIILSIKSSSHSIGHAIVVDGYFETNNYYHVNPGWYGSYSGWYDISGTWDMGTYNIVTGATKGIVPSPQINEIERLTENSFILSWSTSLNQKADFYEVQQARSINGTWNTLIQTSDTTYKFINADKNSYYFQVRANRDSTWWDFSEIKKVQLGTDREVVFQVDMSTQNIGLGDTVVIRGNLLPLKGNANSIPMIKKSNSNIYELKLKFNYDYVGLKLLYRYFIQSKDTLKAEYKNREYTITNLAVQTIPLAFYDDIVDVHDLPKIINEFKIEQNYPNPFNPITTISYTIPEIDYQQIPNSLTKVVIDIYNILGQKIRTLVNEEQKCGNYTIKFDASNLPSGVYLYKIIAGQNIETKKMVLLK